MLFNFFRARNVVAVKSQTRANRRPAAANHPTPPTHKVFAPDRIGIVGFHTDGFVVARPAEPFAPWLQQRSMEIHTKMKPNTGTNITAGIRTAVQLMKPVPKGVLKRIWLLSDGAPNHEVDGIAAAVDEARRAYININTIGFGDSFDESLLRRISSMTHNGKFVSVKSLRELTEALIVSDNGTTGQRRHHHRSETTVLAIDLSPSMHEPMEGSTKIAVAERAILELLNFKQKCFA